MPNLLPTAQALRAILIATLTLPAARLGAADPITSGYGADGPYAGAAITVFTIANPTAVGVALKPVQAYVAATAPAGKRPVLLLSHGYGGDEVYPVSRLPLLYPDLVRFAVGKGWSVVFAPYPKTGLSIQQRYDVLWGGFAAAAADAQAGARIDTTRIGIFGHSFGGGTVPWLAWRATAVAGWGTGGSFALICAPWYRFRMTPERLAQLPPTMAVLIQVYDQDTANDHRMAIECYGSLPQPRAGKDLVRISGGAYAAADHATPSSGGPNAVLDDLDWFAVYRPIDALADHAWNGVDAGRDVAIGHGSTAQTAAPAPISLVSMADAPTASQPTPLDFPWSDRDEFQPPPTVALALPAGPQLAGAIVTLSATAAATVTEANGASLERVSFRAGGSGVGDDATSPYAIAWTVAGTGAVTVEAEAMDDNGRTATASGTLTVVAPTSGTSGGATGSTGSGGGGTGGGGGGCGLGSGGLALALAASAALRLRRCQRPDCSRPKAPST